VKALDSFHGLGMAGVIVLERVPEDAVIAVLFYGKPKRMSRESVQTMHEWLQFDGVDRRSLDVTGRG
jgi:hypothetical protein